MRMTAAIALVTAGLSLSLTAPAFADRGHGHDWRRAWDGQAHGQGYGQPNGEGTQIQAVGNGLTITQNGNGNSVGAVQQGGGGALTITQNGNNNSVTVIQVNRGGRRAHGWH